MHALPRLLPIFSSLRVFAFTLARFALLALSRLRLPFARLLACASHLRILRLTLVILALAFFARLPALTRHLALLHLTLAILALPVFSSLFASPRLPTVLSSLAIFALPIFSRLSPLLSRIRFPSIRRLWSFLSLLSFLSALLLLRLLDQFIQLILRHTQSLALTAQHAFSRLLHAFPQLLHRIGRFALCILGFRLRSIPQLIPRLLQVLFQPARLRLAHSIVKIAVQQRFTLLRLLAELSHAVQQFFHLLLLLRHLPALRRILHVLLDVRPRLLLILQRLADLLLILRSVTRLLADLLHLLGKFFRSLLPKILLHLFQLTLRTRR